MVFGEIPLAGKSDKNDQGGVITMLCSFGGNRAVDFMLIEGAKSKVAAVRTSDDSPLTMTAQKFSHVGNKVTFHALAKHIELIFVDVPPVINRLAFYGEIPDSDTTAKQTFSNKEVNAARKTAAAGAKARSKGKGPAKKPAAVKKPRTKTKVKVKPSSSKPSVPPSKESDLKKVRVKFPKGTKRGTFSHIDTTKAPPPAIPPGALVINPPRVPVIRDEEEAEEDQEDEDTTIKNNDKETRT